MGTSTSVGQFAAKLSAGGPTAVSETVRDGVMKTAQTGKAIFLANMGTTRLRNVGKGAKVGARYDAGAVSPTDAAALVYYTGPVHIINNPTRPHAIYPRGVSVRNEDGSAATLNSGRTRRRRRDGAQGLAFPDGNVRSYANHPGTAGKKFFERSKPQVEAARDRIMRAQLSVSMRKVF